MGHAETLFFYAKSYWGKRRRNGLQDEVGVPPPLVSSSLPHASLHLVR